MFNKRIDQNIYIQVYEEVLAILKERSDVFKEVEQEKGLSPQMRVFVAGLKDKAHIEKQISYCDVDEKDLLVLFVKKDVDTFENVSFSKSIRTVHTTKEKLLDDLNDILERWTCDVAKMRIYKFFVLP